MKKIILFILFLTLELFFFTAKSIAQTPQAVDIVQPNQPMRVPVQKLDMLKQRMMDELKLSYSKADSVVAIQLQFIQGMKQVRADRNFSEEERKAKIFLLTEQRKKRFKMAGLTDTEAKNVETFYENMQKASSQKPIPQH